MKTNLNNKNILAKGFSLVEMLVVIAVIGVIAAIAIPSIGSINSAAATAKNQRNAQSICSIYASGKAAGADFGTTPVTTICNGGANGTGAFSTQTFQVPGMSSDDITAAKAYIDANVSYFDAGGQTGAASL